MSKIIHTSGKRKRSIARATLKKGTGLVRVNHVPIDIFQPTMARLKLREPLILSGNIAQEVNININVKGGGIMSQTDAARLALARALGETAPLLMIGMIAFIPDTPIAITDPSTALPAQIFMWADHPERAFIERTSAAILILLSSIWSLLT